MTNEGIRHFSQVFLSWSGLHHARAYLWDQPSGFEYDMKETVQQCLLLISVICVSPALLVMKGTGNSWDHKLVGGGGLSRVSGAFHSRRVASVLTRPKGMRIPDVYVFTSCDARDGWIVEKIMMGFPEDETGLRNDKTSPPSRFFSQYLSRNSARPACMFLFLQVRIHPI